ncbi:hypothetical protein IFM89_027718 [Coptis chinensis]|uniref:RNase H type-1 domain-containing protein n=1 Tax=Coptis chinensis TaxID=261450 RepID=A0A835HWV6_9MAGN|nr:hypothetical protein IFM89_027718 [Coptis chinensis]
MLELYAFKCQQNHIKTQRTRFTQIALAFSNGHIPWVLKSRWERATAALSYYRISHTWRETNFSADAAAKHGATLDQDDFVWSVERPPFVTRLENQDQLYFRFP